MGGPLFLLGRVLGDHGDGGCRLRGDRSPLAFSDGAIPIGVIFVDTTRASLGLQRATRLAPSRRRPQIDELGQGCLGGWEGAARQTSEQGSALL